MQIYGQIYIGNLEKCPAISLGVNLGIKFAPNPQWLQIFCISRFLSVNRRRIYAFLVTTMLQKIYTPSPHI